MYGIVSCLIVLAVWLPHVLQLLFQLCLVTLTKILSAHLLGWGEVMKSLSEKKAMLFLQRVRRHIGQVSSTHLGKKNKDKKRLKKRMFVVGIIWTLGVIVLLKHNRIISPSSADKKGNKHSTDTEVSMSHNANDDHKTEWKGVLMHRLLHLSEPTFSIFL